jgi:hypothetical protein
MPFSGELAISWGGGATYQFMTPDGSNVTVALYLQGQLVGAETLNANKTSASLGGGGGVGGSTAWSASLDIGTGSGGVTTLSWSGSNSGPSSSNQGTISAWATP